MRILKRFFVFVLLLFSLPVQQALAQPKNIDQYINEVMKTFEVPGISFALVKDGKVVLAKGYGVRKLGDKTPVDKQTLFGIASNTKAFTATALGLLVEEGKLDWDGKVVFYLPWFRMSDPYVTAEMTIRDLLVHRSGLGLGAGDLLWWPASDYSRDEIVRRLRFIPLETSFRSAYAYDNVLYSVAGEVIKEVSGQPWEDFVSSRILAKVGMNGSNVRHSGSGSHANVAAPHARIDETVRPIAPFASDNVNPAGGINSNAEDLAKWMIVQLDSGRVSDGSRLFSRQTSRQLWGPVTPMPVFNPPPDLTPLRANFNNYALGFNVRDYRGVKLVNHTGGLPGFVSKIAMLPELKVGVAILTNQESGAAFEAITYFVLDYYLKAQPHDWLAAYKKLMASRSSRVADFLRAAASSRDSTSKPSLPLERYAGTYTDPWYGDIIVTFANGKLGMRFSHSPELVGDLEHWQYDTFVARWHDRTLRADAYVTWALNPDGSIDQVKMKGFSPDIDFSFDFEDLLLKPKPGK